VLCSEPVEQRRLWEPDFVERDASVVQVVCDGLVPHVLDADAAHKRAVPRLAQTEEEGVWAVRDAADAQVGHHDA